MKKLLLSLGIFLSSCAPAHAAAPCFPSQVGGSGTAADFVLTPEVTSVGVPQEDGTVKGTGIAPTYVLWWYCTNPYEPTTTVVRWCVKDLLLTECLINGVEESLYRKDTVSLAKIDALNVRDDVLMNDEVAKVVEERILPNKPPSPVWKVKPNGTYTTRPAYPIVNGVRSTTSTARATIGAVCDMSVRSVEGTSSYGAHDSTRSTVTLCIK